MELIDKSAVVAEIGKLQLCTMDEHMNFYSPEAQGEYNALCKLDSFIDTLEVKEVDLEKEIDIWYQNKASKEFEKVFYEDIEECAKHFFELGLKAKGK